MTSIAQQHDSCPPGSATDRLPGHSGTLPPCAQRSRGQRVAALTSRRLAAPLAMILVLVALDALLRSRGDFDYRLVRGFRRIDLKTWRRSAGIHSPLVVLLAAMPGIGTFAYLLSWPMLSRFSLVRVAADAVEEHRPFDIYRRLGMKRIVARPVRYQPRPQDAAGTPGGGE